MWAMTEVLGKMETFRMRKIQMIFNGHITCKEVHENWHGKYKLKVRKEEEKQRVLNLKTLCKKMSELELEGVLREQILLRATRGS